MANKAGRSAPDTETPADGGFGVDWDSLPFK